jgi:hypothetical protein
LSLDKHAPIEAPKMTTRLHQLIRDPERSCREPASLVQRRDLSMQEKLVVLESWQADLIELLKAVEENMSDMRPDRGDSAAKLAEVTAAITAVRRNEESSR